ncbi:transposase [Streptomyces sp. DH37]|uniref:transposase n=1 Tax=Streptomyces sp. DH37 TaxID=3040122 RepID=UPI0024427E62|nr:transposase [Streptomyces sp. DH37]MDG9701358.1 transposase [Streptomyces sp. DH37]
MPESPLKGEITDRLGCDKHDAAGRNGGDSRNGKRGETTVPTGAGPVETVVPRDREGIFEAKVVRKRRKRPSGVDEAVVPPPSAKGLATGEVRAHLAEVCGADVSRQTIPTITGKATDGTAERRNRPLRSGLPGGLHRRRPCGDP